ncbi:hypothetical protein J2Y38_000832 [Flavobacterium sp. 2755]|uniref:hypothetical protein n=1 Tax=Flavobacterium sp. 2755 TaxID=2817765 RepID=UPI002864E971|nr:hypothetical protein [Flavobacterium sp. 2755]MDR6760634.1 hypothetical protein [Flavobacterium sp. 2755]
MKKSKQVYLLLISIYFSSCGEVYYLQTKNDPCKEIYGKWKMYKRSYPNNKFRLEEFETAIWIFDVDGTLTINDSIKKTYRLEYCEKLFIGLDSQSMNVNMSKDTLHLSRISYSQVYSTISFKKIN